MDCPSCHNPVDPNERFCKGCGAEIPPDPLLGMTLGGKYKIIRLLGEGGMGCVYHGEQPMGTTVRKVAIKTLHKHLSADPKIQARFEREVGTVAELQHPNTIQVFDFGTTDDKQLYIVMEFVEGASLARTLETGGPLTPERTRRILEQVVGSLEEAHAMGIIHRDLKPENVVLTQRAGKSDFVKVLDFGIAKRGGEEDKNEQKLTQQGMVLGTPPYMSPEQFTGRPIDARSDIYSLAVMAYEMLTGRLPFEADTAWEWASKHMTQPPTPIESQPSGADVPEPMRQAIARGLAKNPDQRFASVREFYDAFAVGADAYAGRPSTVSAPGQMPGGQVRIDSGVGGPVSAGGKTEIGAAFIPPGPGGAVIPSHPSYGTPAGGNVSFPTPSAGMPHPPPHAQANGGNRKLLLAIIAVVGVGSLAAIGFALAPKSRKPVDLGGITTEIAADAAPAVTAATLEDAAAAPTETAPDTALPPLSEGTTPPPAPAQQTSTKTVDAGKAATTTTTKDAGAAKPAGKEPPECASARMMLKINRQAEYQRLAAICRAGGGTP
jgi:serine/threonine-protein kinase